MKLVFTKRVNPGHTRYAASNPNAEIMLKLMRKATASKEDLVLMAQLEAHNGNPATIKIISRYEVVSDFTDALTSSRDELTVDVNDETVTNSTTNVTNSDVTESPVEKTTASNAHSKANINQDDQSPFDVNDRRFAEYKALCAQLTPKQQDKWTKQLKRLRFSDGDFVIDGDVYRYDTLIKALNTRLTNQATQLVNT